MLHAYIAGARGTWAEWLHLLEFTYNSNPHATTGCAPYFLLYGFNPLAPSGLLSRSMDDEGRQFGIEQGEVARETGVSNT